MPQIRISGSTGALNGLGEAIKAIVQHIAPPSWDRPVADMKPQQLMHFPHRGLLHQYKAYTELQTADALAAANAAEQVEADMLQVEMTWRGKLRQTRRQLRLILKKYHESSDILCHEDDETGGTAVGDGDELDEDDDTKSSTGTYNEAEEDEEGQRKAETFWSDKRRSNGRGSDDGSDSEARTPVKSPARKRASLQGRLQSWSLQPLDAGDSAVKAAENGQNEMDNADADDGIDTLPAAFGARSSA